MANSTCSVPGCERPIKNKVKALCDPHYKRFWRHGDVQSHIPLLNGRTPVRPVEDHPDGTRSCQDCGERKALDQFHADPNSPLGRKTRCAICRTKQESVRHADNADRIRARIRQYRRDHPELVRAQEAAAYERHKDARIADAIANSHLRRARMRGQGFERGVTVPALRVRDGDHCHYCGEVMLFVRATKGNRPALMATLEHKQAISRGGQHSWANCVLACWGCNSAKGARDYPVAGGGREAQHADTVTTTSASVEEQAGLSYLW